MEQLFTIPDISRALGVEPIELHNIVCRRAVPADYWTAYGSKRLLLWGKDGVELFRRLLAVTYPPRPEGETRDSAHRARLLEWEDRDNERGIQAELRRAGIEGDECEVIQRWRAERVACRAVIMHVDEVFVLQPGDAVYVRAVDMPALAGAVEPVKG